jgi:hypothetical protein
MTDVDELYALAPEEFTAARNALAKQLKADGHKDEAAEVAKLRRPSVAAWALNQVARSSPDVVEAAIAAGEELRAATEATVAGKAGELRAATAAERAAANAVVKAAATHLGPRADALGPALLATIRVAALDEEVADQLRRGVLVSEQEQPGFGFGVDDETPLASVTKLAPRRAAKAAKVAKDTKDAKAAKAARTTKAGTANDAARAKAQAEAEKAERAAAREAERVRKKELTARQRTLDRKTREAKRLAKEADEAEAEAQEARALADQAEADAEAAQRAVEEISDPA